MAVFDSDIQVRPGVGVYAGRWEVYRVSTGDRITDCATSAIAEKQARQCRKTAKARAAAERSHDAAIASIHRGTFQNRSIQQEQSR